MMPKFSGEQGNLYQEAMQTIFNENFLNIISL